MLFATTPNERPMLALLVVVLAAGVTLLLG